jgi:CRISPR-associated protein Cas1
MLSFCADHNVAVITSDAKHMPNGLLLPFAAHSLHSATLRAQIASGVPAQKRTWQSIIRAKVRAQADAIREIGGDDSTLRKLIPLVRSGDPDNIEARAAGRYFELLFGAQFLRDRDAPGVNACLNYGYAVVRSTVARAIVGAGLHPALGVFHRNQYNAFCLVDDAMEPLRPLVDRLVWEMVALDSVPDELDPPTKRRLVGVIGSFVSLGELRFPLLVGLERYAAGLRRAICDGEPLEVPLPASRSDAGVVGAG